jgi:hypothetical protein
MTMRRGLNWIGCIGLGPALLLGPLASFAFAPPMKDGPRVAADPFETRIDSAPLMLRSRPETQARPKFSAADSAGLSRQEPASLAVPDSIPGLPGPTKLNYRGTCKLSSSGLCYDLADQHIVYAPARLYMPKFKGLTADSVSLRSDSIPFKNSFR